MNANDINIRLERIKKSFKYKCSDVFTEVERAHLEEVLHGDLSGYWEEIKDVDATDSDFKDWKKKTLGILKKCKLNKWDSGEESTEDERFEVYAHGMELAIEADKDKKGEPK